MREGSFVPSFSEPCWVHLVLFQSFPSISNLTIFCGALWNRQCILIKLPFRNECSLIDAVCVSFPGLYTQGAGGHGVIDEKTASTTFCSNTWHVYSILRLLRASVLGAVNNRWKESGAWFILNSALQTVQERPLQRSACRPSGPALQLLKQCCVK